MDTKHILEQVRDGAVSVEEAEQYFRRAPFEELGYAKLDTHRRLRSGFAEVVFCSGKADDYLRHTRPGRAGAGRLPRRGL